jgi:hypothetical protein
MLQCCTVLHSDSATAESAELNTAPVETSSSLLDSTALLGSKKAIPQLTSLHLNHDLLL